MTEKEIEIVMNALAGIPTVTTAEFANKVEKILREYKECDDNEQIHATLKDKGYKVVGRTVTLLGTEFEICEGYIETALGKQKSYWLELRL